MNSKEEMAWRRQAEMIHQMRTSIKNPEMAKAFNKIGRKASRLYRDERPAFYLEAHQKWFNKYGNR